jgi:hypothetical protein
MDEASESLQFSVLFYVLYNLQYPIKYKIILQKNNKLLKKDREKIVKFLFNLNEYYKT